MSVTSVLVGLEMTTPLGSWLPGPSRFGAISEMFVLVFGGFHQKFCLCVKEVGII